MKNKLLLILILIASIISLSLSIYKHSSVPRCTNADEASFGYNAFSILKTGGDEYGTKFPIRLKSFGDYKMPGLTYFEIPFIAMFGLNDQAVHLPNIFLSIFVPIVMFLLIRELFSDVRVAIIGAFLSAFSLGLHIIGRQNHEAYLNLVLVSLSLLFFIRILKHNLIKDKFLFLALSVLSLFTYHPSRIYIFLIFVTYVVYALIRKIKSWGFIIVFLLTLVLFGGTDIIYKPQRIQNLLFIKNQGFRLKIDELRGEEGSRLLYNKLTVGIKDLSNQYLTYLSPQFFVATGDINNRFGFEGMSIISAIEYIFLFIGLYYLFRNKERYNYFLLFILLMSPLPASLSWAGQSLSRSFLILVPVYAIASYGIFSSIIRFKKYWYLFAAFITIPYIFFAFYSWDFYLNHYAKRAVVIRGWQCGYKKLADYVKTNYGTFDNFYITRKNGQPYIFLLYYLNYPPYKFQQQAKLSTPDEFGFGTVERFDKFVFDFKYPLGKRSALVGFPDDFADLIKSGQIDSSEIKKIKIGTEEIFWIYEVR